MKKTLKLAVPMAALAALLSLSAFAEDRPRDETWRNGGTYNDRNDNRNGNRNDNRDRDYRDNDRRDNDRRDYRNDNREFVRGVIERIDYRRDVIVLREGRGGRRITVDMDRVDQRRRNRLDESDLRRGDVVTLAGEWRRGGVFEAFRIADVDSGRRW